MCLALVAVGVIVGACGGKSANEGPGKAQTAKTSTTTASTGVLVVALGDSETTGSGDPTGLGWVGRYARLLRRKRHLNVHVTNLAVEGKTSTQLVSDVRHGPSTRAALAKAQVVLLGIGGADLNAGDDAFQAGECRAEACYAPVLRTLARNLDAAAAAIRELRGSNTTVLRAITQMNVLTGAEDVIPPFLKRIATRLGVYQARTANRAICRAMAKHEGRCIQLLEPFNGPDGTEDGYKKGLLNHEDCCYPNAKGQQLMAELLLKTGLAPVR